MSSARRAAEAAFAAPAVPPAQPRQAQITVRRARAPLHAQPPAAEPRAAAAAAKPSTGPRVFRVDTTGALPLATAPPDAPRPDPSVAAEPSVPRMRRRRAAADKRPGPVVVVVAPAAAPARPPAAAHPRPDSERLGDALARVAPVLQAAAQARSLQFVDKRFEDQWFRLLEQADQLLRQIRDPAR